MASQTGTDVVDNTDAPPHGVGALRCIYRAKLSNCQGAVVMARCPHQAENVEDVAAGILPEKDLVLQHKLRVIMTKGTEEHGGVHLLRYGGIALDVRVDI